MKSIKSLFFNDMAGTPGGKSIPNHSARSDHDARPEARRARLWLFLFLLLAFSFSCSSCFLPFSSCGLFSGRAGSPRTKPSRLLRGSFSWQTYPPAPCPFITPWQIQRLPELRRLPSLLEAIPGKKRSARLPPWKMPWRPCRISRGMSSPPPTG